MLEDSPSMAEYEESDITSDEDEIPGPDSDDVDSDGLEDEMLLGANDGSVHALSQQDDFVHF